MALQYYLAENLLTPDPNDYIARTHNVTSITLQQILDRMMERGYSFKRTDAHSAVDAFFKEIGFIIAEGNSINTPYINTKPVMSGVYNSPNDTFDSARHKLQTRVQAGVTIKAATEKITVQKITPPATGAQITAIVDKTTGDTNSTLTANAPIEITGKNIKLITADATNGVFFIAADGSEQTTPLVVLNEPRRLLVMTPALVAGDYTVEVRTTYSGGGNPSKTLRTYRFRKTLTVS